MGMVAFDPLKFVEQLENSGISHAKAPAQAFAEATAEQLATKSDLLAAKFFGH